MNNKNIQVFSLVFSQYFINSMILLSPMIASEKSHQNLLDYNRFLFLKYIKLKKWILSSEKMRNSSNYIYD